MRTLLIDLSRQFGGANSRALALLAGLSGEGNAIAVLKNSPVARQTTERRFETFTVGNHKLDCRILSRLVRVVQRQGIQVIDTQNPQSQVWGRLAAARTGVALVSTLNSWYIDEHRGSLKGRFYQTLQTFTNSGVDLFITVSNEIRDRLLDCGVPEAHIAVIPNAISVEPDAIDADHSALCREFDFPGDAFVCCSVGRLVEAKGYPHLLAGVRQIADSHPRLHCVIIGDGHLRQALSIRIQQLGLQKRVRLAGFRLPDQTLRLLKSADAFVMPSLSEGTPVALLEAAGLGKPIVASRVGGIPSILASDEHALLVNPGDETALARALVELHCHPRLAHRRADAAQAHVFDHFGLKAQIEATKAAYERALANARQRHANSCGGSARK